MLQPPMSGAPSPDEVGFGRTIEAGIILKQLAVGGLARILILTPRAWSPSGWRRWSRSCSRRSR